MTTNVELKRKGTFTWEIPQHGNMLVPGRVYLAPEQIDKVKKDRALEQVVNVAHLPGIVGHSLAMPDIHWGYGFPIGGVAAVDAEDGAISPGGVGYDINCGVRVIVTDLNAGELKPRLRDLVKELFRTVPTGIGASRSVEKLSDDELAAVLGEGAQWAVDRGYAAQSDDAEHCEEGGCLAGADPEAVSKRAYDRGRSQVGTLGSGNHFLEVQRVDEIYDDEAAKAFGVHKGQVTVMIHSGSRGLGHQTCDEALRLLTGKFHRYGPRYAAIPDKQLACAPVGSDEGKRYLAAMQAAANFAWANRQVMTGLAVDVITRTLDITRRELKPRLLYDVCHNIAKVETHEVDGRERRLVVHRKGATRAFGPGDPRVPARYRAVGQPVMIPGDMGRYSFTCSQGNPGAMREAPSARAATARAACSPAPPPARKPAGDASIRSSASRASR